MPNVCNVNFRTGYRSNWLIAEAVLDQTWTLGGFDISKNNMPFVSNRMNSTKVGLHLKYEVKKINGLSIVADAMQTVTGRCLGKATSISGGIFYMMNYNKKKATNK